MSDNGDNTPTSSTRVVKEVEQGTAQVMEALADMEKRILTAVTEVGDKIVSTIEISSKPFADMAGTMQKAAEAVGAFWRRLKEVGWRAFLGASTVGGGTAFAWWQGFFE